MLLICHVTNGTVLIYLTETVRTHFLVRHCLMFAMLVGAHSPL